MDFGLEYLEIALADISNGYRPENLLKLITPTAEEVMKRTRHLPELP